LLKSLLVPFSPHEVAVRRTITHLVTDLRSARELLGT
jgi:hypothetical protein